MALFWITVGALMGNVTDGTERDQWNNVVIAACTVPAGIVVAYAAFYISDKPPDKPPAYTKLVTERRSNTLTVENNDSIKPPNTLIF